MGELSRVCLLTGASGLLGGAFLERCASRYRVVAVHHRGAVEYATQDQLLLDPLDPLADLPENEHAAYAIRADVRRRDEVERVVEETLEHFGRIDLLVNAAGVRAWSPLLAAGGLDAASELLAVNVLAPLWFAVAAAQRFWRERPEENARLRRNVVNVSSSAGLHVYPDLGQALYASSKAALNHLTYHLASELWDLGVRVNAIAPDSFPGRVATEDVIAAILAFDEGEERLTGRLEPILP